VPYEDLQVEDIDDLVAVQIGVGVPVAIAGMGHERPRQALEIERWSDLIIQNGPKRTLFPYWLRRRPFCERGVDLKERRGTSNKKEERREAGKES
jgi:hypothetical protein